MQPTVADAPLLAPDGGPLLLEVSFSDTSEGYTGVQFVLSGELVGMPGSVELEPDELVLVNRIRSCVRAMFEAACRELDPLYGGVDFEWRLPAPIDLSSDHARLPSDLYVSEAVIATDRELVPALTALYGVDSIPLASGTLFPGGGVIDSTHPVTADPVTTGRAAASRLARAL